MILSSAFYHRLGGVSTLSITIFSMSRQGIKPKINALSTIMFAFVLMLLIIVNVRQAREQKKERNGRHGSKKNKLVLMLLGLMTLSLILSGCRQAKPTLYVYNWGGDYIDEDILDEFEKETGMKIVYDTLPQTRICM